MPGGGGRPILEELKPLLVPNTKLAFKAEVLQSCGFRKSSRKVHLVQYSGVIHSSTFWGHDYRKWQSSVTAGLLSRSPRYSHICHALSNFRTVFRINSWD